MIFFIKNDYFEIMKIKKNGFTLFETMVVIVVACIILSSAIYLENILTSSRVVDLQSQFNQVRVASEMFKELYGQLPGDIDYTIEPDITTEVGNNNGLIGNNVIVNSEVFNFFPHLAKTGMISSKNMNETSTPVKSDIQKYLMPSEMEYINFYVLASDLNGKYNKLNRIFLINNRNAELLNAVIARKIDCKFDNCEPTTGKILSYNLVNVSESAEYRKCVIMKDGKLIYNTKSKYSNCTSAIIQLLNLKDKNKIKGNINDKFYKIK